MVSLRQLPSALDAVFLRAVYPGSDHLVLSKSTNEPTHLTLHCHHHRHPARRSPAIDRYVSVAAHERQCQNRIMLRTLSARRLASVVALGRQYQLSSTSRHTLGYENEIRIDMSMVERLLLLALRLTWQALQRIEGFISHVYQLWTLLAKHASEGAGLFLLLACCYGYAWLWAWGKPATDRWQV